MLKQSVENYHVLLQNLWDPIPKPLGSNFKTLKICSPTPSFRSAWRSYFFPFFLHLHSPQKSPHNHWIISPHPSDHFPTFDKICDPSLVELKPQSDSSHRNWIFCRISEIVQDFFVMQHISVNPLFSGWLFRF